MPRGVEQAFALLTRQNQNLLKKIVLIDYFSQKPAEQAEIPKDHTGSLAMVGYLFIKWTNSLKLQNTSSGTL